eukprot:m.47256 g.47256  ORF g.47256 m.47256 type:complete len:348 (+) comp8837_c0_seq1:307-1350(+)
MFAADASGEGPSTASDSAPPLVSASQLQAMLGKGEPLVLCDVRSSSSYNKGHILGAFSLACSSLHVRRLARGKGALKDLVSGEAKTPFTAKLHEGVPIIVYDDRSTSVTAHNSNPLHLFRTILNNHGHGQVAVLRGGYHKFSSVAPHLCEQPARPTSSMSLQLPAVSHGDPVAGPDCGAEENEDRYQRRAAVFDTPPTEIIPNLLLGGQKDAENPELLRRLGVFAVLNVTPESPARSHGPEIFYKQLPILDTWHQNVSSYFDETFEFIETHRERGGVLVHCRAGISRSPTIVMAYLMKKNGWSLDATYAHVRQSRGIVSPNLDFMGHLHEHERTLGVSSSESDSSLP